MFFLRSILLAALVIVASRFEQAASSAKTVQLQYNGLGWTMDTTANDVADLLVAQFGGYADWQIDPIPETRLADGMTVYINDSAKTQLSPLVASNYQAQHQKAAPASIPKPPAVYSGLATWYRFGDKLTTASRKYPKGTTLRVVAVSSGKSVDVVVNDFGPSLFTGVDLDLNQPAFAAIAPITAGKIRIKYYKL